MLHKPSSALFLDMYSEGMFEPTSGVGSYVVDRNRLLDNPVPLSPSTLCISQGRDGSREILREELMP